MNIKNKWLLKYHHWCWGSRAKTPTVKDFIIFNVIFYVLIVMLGASLLGLIVSVHAPRKRAKADADYHSDLFHIVDALKEQNRLEQKQNELLQRLLNEVHEMNRRARPLKSNSDLKQFDNDR